VTVLSWLLKRWKSQLFLITLFDQIFCQDEKDTLPPVSKSASINLALGFSRVVKGAPDTQKVGCFFQQRLPISG
jgi:hypothetical protein